ncbi:hypothetical protein ACET8D_04420 [Aeromonas veronii]|uniref:hypothetical protein n=1 Tax=Aeromonas veronii TaxID=654 RepID=UPI002B4867AD|nr:hypothetical protein [Aeromonas veronii]
MKTPFQENKEKAEIIYNLTSTIRMQIEGDMDRVNARAYWETTLPTLNLAYLAEALSWTLPNALRDADQRKQ